MTTTMLDTIGSSAGGLASLNAGIAKIAGYVTGSGGIAWGDADWARFPHASHVRIDQSPDGHAPLQSDVLDVESGAATPAVAVDWIKRRIAAGITWSTIYGGADTLAAVHAALEAAGQHGWYYGHVYAWLANWNLNQTGAAAQIGQQASGLTIVAVQWASPASNPHTLVPGTNTTLAAANVDLSETADSWFPPPGAPPITQSGILIESASSGSYVGRGVVSTDGGKSWR